MKILLVNTYDRGGAANACIRLHLGLLAAGAQSTLLVLHKTRQDIPRLVQFEPNSTLALRFKQRLKDSLAYRLGIKDKRKVNKEEMEEVLENRNKHLELFSSPYSEYDITKSEYYKSADIVNLHWISRFVDLPSFLKKNKKPIFWTMHDMFPITGGEHYEESFLGISKEGFPNKNIADPFSINQANKHIKILSNSLMKSEITYIAPSDWLKSEAMKKYFINSRKCFTIRYGFDTSIFYFKPKQKQVKIKILFVSDNISNERKGLSYLLKAIDSIDNNNLEFISVGNGTINHPKLNHLGSIKSEQSMAQVYQQADFFVIPSLMDNLPNTMIESLLCGTPVIGFPVGGIKEVIQNGKNGFLCNDISVNSLAKGIMYAADHYENFDFEKIAKNAFIQFDILKQATSYLSKFNNSLP